MMENIQECFKFKYFYRALSPTIMFCEDENATMKRISCLNEWDDSA